MNNRHPTDACGRSDEEEARFRRGQVAELFAAARRAYMVSPVNAAILSAILWVPALAGALSAWLLAMLVVTLGRLAIHRAFVHSVSRDSAPLVWERRFALGALMSGAVWAAGAALFFGASAPAGQVALVFVIGGSIIGAAALYGASRLAFYSFSILPVVFTAGALLAQEAEAYRLTALMVAVFGLAMTGVFAQMHRAVCGALAARLHNESLSDSLGKSEALLRDALAGSPDGIAVYDGNGRLVTCNDHYAALYAPGKSPGQLGGLPYRAVAESAFDFAELPDGRGVLDREAWIAQRIASQRAGDGTLHQYCARDGRWLQGRTVRTKLGNVVEVFTDVSSLKRAESAFAEQRRQSEHVLRESERMYRSLVETCNDLIWSLDRDGRWTYLNPAAVRRIYGYEPAELIGRPFVDLLADEVRERDIAVFGRILQGEHVSNYETRHLRRDGTQADLSFTAIPLRDASGSIIGATGTARDVTDVKQATMALYESVERLRLAVDAADLYYWEWEVATDRLSWGREPSHFLGGEGRGAAGATDFRALIHPDDREHYDAAGRRALQTGAPYFCEFRMIGRDASVSWVAARAKVVYGEDGDPVRMIGVSQDVTQRKREEEAVRYLAYHDTLTGLPNRRLLEDRLRQAVFVAQRRQARLGLMVIDLDDFKSVNDTLGHKAGDAILREVAKRLAGCVRKADTLARQGGDEFVIVVPEVELDTDCSIVAEKILRTLAPEFRIDGREFTIGASIGISMFPTDAGDGEALLRNGDVAMYRAKESGRNNYRFYRG